MTKACNNAGVLVPDASRSFLRRVRVRNYKSIGKCEVELAGLTILVGRNGSGKSNFLDALRFVVDGLQTSLEHAVKSRGGIEAVRRRSTGHPRNFAIELVLDLPGHRVATYGFEIAARGPGVFVVKQERLRVSDLSGQVLATYQVAEGHVESASAESLPPVTADRLYLVNVSGFPAFRGVCDALLSMGFYNLNPDSMKELQNPDAGELLKRDGSNVASVIARLRSEKPELFERIKAYLRRIVPDITEVTRTSLGPKETLKFHQRVTGSRFPWTFYAVSMSDGTLRTLGALVAVTQLVNRKLPVSLVGIEEPETALHPAAASALMDALREAGAHTQVLVTTHSPDLLDQVDPHRDGLLIAESREGLTHIAPVDRASFAAIKDHLYTPGDLLRMDQFEPDEDDLKRQRQLRLFEHEDDG